VEPPAQLVELPPQLVDLLVSALRRWAPSSPTAASQLSTGTCQIATEQQRLVLTYDAFRTALGRPGAASLATFRIAQAKDGITLNGPIPGGNLQAVAYAQNGAEIKRGPLERAGPDYFFPIDVDLVTRLEVYDESCRPILLAVPDSTPGLIL
jgi:hypothetical protein